MQFVHRRRLVGLRPPRPSHRRRRRRPGTPIHARIARCGCSTAGLVACGLGRPRLASAHRRTCRCWPSVDLQTRNHLPRSTVDLDGGRRATARGCQCAPPVSRQRTQREARRPAHIPSARRRRNARAAPGRPGRTFSAVAVTAPPRCVGRDLNAARLLDVDTGGGPPRHRAQARAAAGLVALTTPAPGANGR
jgi:hypothetical protein